MAIPAASIGLPTSGGAVTTAVVTAPSGSGVTAIPEYCLVNGNISPVDSAAPKILFRVALPTVWNGKAVMFGGGGFDGTIPAVAGNVPQRPDRSADAARTRLRDLRQRLRPSGQCPRVAGWLPSSVNDEAVAKLGRRRNEEDARRGDLPGQRALRRRAPRRAYFAGGSTGGREALAAIQRWPADWNGAIAWYPAWNDAAALLGRPESEPAHWRSRARIRTRQAAGGYSRPRMQACDGLDGVVDGLISNQAEVRGHLRSCHRDPRTARRCAAPAGRIPATRACPTRRSVL